MHRKRTVSAEVSYFPENDTQKPFGAHSFGESFAVQHLEIVFLQDTELTNTKSPVTFKCKYSK